MTKYKYILKETVLQAVADRLNDNSGCIARRLAEIRYDSAQQVKQLEALMKKMQRVKE